MSDSERVPPRRPGPLPTASYALRPDQIEHIRLLSAEFGISRSELMRQAVDLLMRETVRDALDELQRVRGFNRPLSDHAPAPHAPGDDD